MKLLPEYGATDFVLNRLAKLVRGEQQAAQIGPCRVSLAPMGMTPDKKTFIIGQDPCTLKQGLRLQLRRALPYNPGYEPEGAKRWSSDTRPSTLTYGVLHAMKKEGEKIGRVEAGLVTARVLRPCELKWFEFWQIEVFLAIR